MSRHGRLELTFASWPDEEDLVGEITLDGVDVAKVAVRDDGLLVTVYSGSTDFTFPLSDLRSALDATQQRLGPARSRAPYPDGTVPPGSLP